VDNFLMDCLYYSF